MDTERRIMELAESTLRLEKNEGENKVISLREAIKRNVKTGIVLHITSSAALSEIIRQFCGTKPEIHLDCSPATFRLEHRPCRSRQKDYFLQYRTK